MKDKVFVTCLFISISLVVLSTGKASWQDPLQVSANIITGSWEKPDGTEQVETLVFTAPSEGMQDDPGQPSGRSGDPQAGDGAGASAQAVDNDGLTERAGNNGDITGKEKGEKNRQEETTDVPGAEGDGINGQQQGNQVTDGAKKTDNAGMEVSGSGDGAVNPATEQKPEITEADNDPSPATSGGAESEPASTAGEPEPAADRKEPASPGADENEGAGSSSAGNRPATDSSSGSEGDSNSSSDNSAATHDQDASNQDATAQE